MRSPLSVEEQSAVDREFAAALDCAGLTEAGERALVGVLAVIADAQAHGLTRERLYGMAVREMLAKARGAA